MERRRGRRVRMRVRLRLCVRWRREIMTFKKALKGLFSTEPDHGPKEGVYKFDGKGELAHHRFHLRVDREGKGVLIVDASKLIFLNGTALDYTKCVLEGLTDNASARYMRRRYKKLDRTTALKHLSMVRTQLMEFLHG